MQLNAKHLLIDATSITNRLTGMERYTRELTTRMCNLHNECDLKVTILLAKNSENLFTNTITNKFLILHSPIASRIITEQLWIPSVIYRVRPSICFFPAFPPSPLAFVFTNCKITKTVYDAVMWKLPQTLSLKNKVYMKPLETYGISRYDKIFTISDHALGELTDIFPEIKGKIENSSIGIDYNKFNTEYSSGDVVSFRLKYNVPDKFLLFIGTLEPRKNLIFLLEVIAHLHTLNHNIKLVIAGRFGWGVNEVQNFIQKNGLQSTVQLLGAVPDNELPALYKAATIFVFPSLYEGFGLPVIEAMAAGTPVIASNTSSIPEAGGHSAILLSPINKIDWSNAILKVYYNESLREKMIKEGFRQAAKFDWNIVAKKILEAL